MRHRWLDKLAMVGYVAGARRADDLGEVFLGRDRYCILNPITPELTNIGLVFNRREFHPTSDLTHSLLEAARSFPGLRDRLSYARPIAAARCLGPLAFFATRLTAPGALLIGDAAGFLDPLTGEGMYAALRSAELAVEAATPLLVMNSDRNPKLPAYDHAWRRELHAKWRLCTGLQHAIRHPLLADWLASRLARSPDLAGMLMAAVGDLIPAHGPSLLHLLLLPRQLQVRCPGLPPDGPPGFNPGLSRPQLRDLEAEPGLNGLNTHV
jgi:hypothetical protein